MFHSESNVLKSSVDLHRTLHHNKRHLEKHRSFWPIMINLGPINDVIGIMVTYYRAGP